jgi:transcriptional regulator with XRE-family HTH domain
MGDRPEPPPWGALIAATLRRAGLSAREAARRAGLSEGRWRQITSGYQVVSPGVYAEVRGPAATLARMAAVAGVTPAELRAAGREDAAEELARQYQPPPDTTDILERVRAMDSDQTRELLATIALQLGIALTTEQDDAESGYGA